MSINLLLMGFFSQLVGRKGSRILRLGGKSSSVCFLMILSSDFIFGFQHPLNLPDISDEVLTSFLY
jgi:hypothetical protein